MVKNIFRKIFFRKHFHQILRGEQLFASFVYISKFLLKTLFCGNKNSGKFSLSVLNNDCLSSDEKKEQKRLFENSQYTKESIGNPYSNMIPVLKYAEVKKIIAKRQHNRKKTEEEMMKEKKTKPAPNPPSMMKNFKKISSLPTNSEIFYLNAPYIGKPRPKRKISTKTKSGSRKKRQKIHSRQS